MADSSAPTNAFGAALVDVSTRKAGLIWLTYGDTGRALAAWHVWVDGVAYVVSGGEEQPLPDIAAAIEVVVTVPSKDTRGRLVSWVADAETVAPDDPRWPAIAATLAAGRLNARDTGNQLSRWTRESVVTALTPTGRVVGDVEVADATSHRAEPPATPATTLGRQPYMFRGVRKADRDR